MQISLLVKLNVGKTHYVIFSPGRRNVEPSNRINVDGQEINRVDSTKFLGVLFDEKMSWKQHTQYICNKISKNIGVLCTAKKVLQFSALITLYYSYLSVFNVLC